MRVLKTETILFLHDNKGAELLVVAGGLPSALLDGLGDLGVDLGAGLLEVLEGELVERSGRLNVGEGGLKVSKLLLDSGGGLLSVGKSLGLKSLNGLELLGDVVGNGLEVLVGGLNLVDNVLVLQGGAVLGEVNLGGLVGELQKLLAGLVVTLAESLEGRDGGASKTKSRNNLGPVDLDSVALEINC